VRYRTVGDCGLRVSAVAYGNWLTHGGYADDATAAKCVAAAVDVGITTFDTADIYAAGLRVAGAALCITGTPLVLPITTAREPQSV
jgi:aryl-alcohol dehydrogenase-like predicted oxidoreductase